MHNKQLKNFSGLRQNFILSHDFEDPLCNYFSLNQLRWSLGPGRVSAEAVWTGSVLGLQGCLWDGSSQLCVVTLLPRGQPGLLYGASHSDPSNSKEGNSHSASAFQASAKGTCAIGLIKVSCMAKPNVSIGLYKGEHMRRRGQVQGHDCNSLP